MSDDSMIFLSAFDFIDDLIVVVGGVLDLVWGIFNHPSLLMLLGMTCNMDYMMSYIL